MVNGPAQVWHAAGEPGLGALIERGCGGSGALLKEIESLNERIKEYDERMEKNRPGSYPEVSCLKQVKGVGTQIALTYCPDHRRTHAGF